uniref:RING finger protein 145-like n=1 Tax=Crassostrea virginica TaxID=6565 RepID=A0A8B8EJX4_CRAVI|nr:RING finger protein 145-like [Crassostrea virginica]
MDELMSAIPELVWVVTTALRFPVFLFVFEKLVFSTEGESWSQWPFKAYGLYFATLTLTLRHDRLFELYCNLTIGILLHYLPFRYLMNVPNPIFDDFTILLCSANGMLAVYLSEVTWKVIIMWVINFPVVAVFIGLPSYITEYIYVFSTTFIIYYLFYRIFRSVYRLVEDIPKRKNLDDLFENYDVLDSIYQLVVYWLLYLLLTYAYSAAIIVKETTYFCWSMSWSDWITFFSTRFEKCCRTYVGLFATSVVVGFATPYARLLLEKCLCGFRDSDVDYTEGLPEGVFFFFLNVVKVYEFDALEDVQHRINHLKVTSSLVMAVFLETTYQLMDSKIVSFSSSKKKSKHIRALMTYILLLFPSFCVIYTVCKLTSIEKTLVIVCLSGSTIIQIVGSLLVYTLFQFNVKYPMDNLNETIFIIRDSLNKLVIAGSVIGTFRSSWMVICRRFDWTPYLITHIYNMYYVRNKYKYEYNTSIPLVLGLASFAYYAMITVEETAHFDWTMSWSDWITCLSTCFEKYCRTHVGLLSISVVVARVTPYARLLLEKFLCGFRKIDRHIHSTEGLPEGLFCFLLNINFGEVKELHIDAHLDVQRRLRRIHVTSFFVIAVFLETTYQMLDTKIMSFVGSTNKFLNHIRALMTYFLLLFSSCYIIYTVCKLASTATALTLASLTCSTIIQILGSLLVYTLILFDVKYSIENLDDTIFYIETSVCILSLAGSMISPFSGFWMIEVEGLGWTLCLIVHIYYQWNKFKNGYDDFISWENGRKKINSFIWATKEEIRNYDDVCSICLHGMSSARITPCRHLYHQGCLQKWLKDYMTCPLCSCRISE